jgi:hypothetical protein
MDGEGRTSEFNHVCEVCHPGSGVVCWKCLGVVIREGWGLLVLRGCLHWEIFPHANSSGSTNLHTRTCHYSSKLLAWHTAGSRTLVSP